MLATRIFTTCKPSFRLAPRINYARTPRIGSCSTPFAKIHLSFATSKSNPEIVRCELFQICDIWELKVARFCLRFPGLWRNFFQNRNLKRSHTNNCNVRQMIRGSVSLLSDIQTLPHWLVSQSQRIKLSHFAKTWVKLLPGWNIAKKLIQKVTTLFPLASSSSLPFLF